jgi:hypothetical protein
VSVPAASPVVIVVLDLAIGVDPPEDADGRIVECDDYPSLAWSV